MNKNDTLSRVITALRGAPKS